VKVSFRRRAWDEYTEMQSTDQALAGKLNALIRTIQRDPFRGEGKPEPLRGQYAGWWSRRITQEHRLVYCVTGKGEEQTVNILQCRGHY
jgi:toxin YoeB